jgi:hypothetical protein
MTRSIIAVGLLALPLAAFATPPHGGTPPPFQDNGGSVGDVSSSSSARSSASAKSTAVGVGLGVGVGIGTGGQGGQGGRGGAGGQGGLGGAGGQGFGGEGGAASASSSSGGNVQSVSIASAPADQRITTRQEGTARIANPPDSTVVVPGATVPCFATYGANVSTPGLGIGFGGGLVDQDCTAREDARTLVSMGMTDAAVARLCQRPDMRQALGARCPSTFQPAAPAPAPVATGAPAGRTPGPFGY